MKPGWRHLLLVAVFLAANVRLTFCARPLLFGEHSEQALPPCGAYDETPHTHHATSKIADCTPGLHEIESARSPRSTAAHQGRHIGLRTTQHTSKLPVNLLLVSFAAELPPLLTDSKPAALSHPFRAAAASSAWTASAVSFANLQTHVSSQSAAKQHPFRKGESSAWSPSQLPICSRTSALSPLSSLPLCALSAPAVLLPATNCFHCSRVSSSGASGCASAAERSEAFRARAGSTSQGRYTEQHHCN